MATASTKKTPPKATKSSSTRTTKAAPITADLTTTIENCNATEQTVKLTIKALPGLSVFVAGSFNQWDPTSIPLTEKKGVYSATIRLAPGIYEYKFVINGVWTLDPDPVRDWTQNGLGTLNSLLRVG